MCEALHALCVRLVFTGTVIAASVSHVCPRAHSCFPSPQIPWQGLCRAQVTWATRTLPCLSIPVLAVTAPGDMWGGQGALGVCG